MSVSYWQHQRTGADASCEVAVIGGGITGISAALELERRGVDVALIEARALGDGASSRNAGYLMRGAADNYGAAVREWGRERARTLWKWTEENLAALIREGVESLATFERRPSCLVAVSEREEGELRASHALLIEDGFESRLVEPGDAPRDALWSGGEARVGLVNPGDAACNPAHLIDHLAGLLGATRVMTGAEVGEITVRDAGVDVATSRGVVRARRALVCTNALAGDLVPALRSLITPNRGQMLAIRPSPGGWRGLEWSYYLDHGSEYIREPTPGVVCVGGGRKHAVDAERTADERAGGAVQAWLEDFARRFVAPEFEVVSRWAGTMGFTPDGLPIVGRACEGDDRVWVCAGFTGHGMSLAFTTARSAVEQMLGGPETPFAMHRFA